MQRTYSERELLRRYNSANDLRAASAEVRPLATTSSFRVATNDKTRLYKEQATFGPPKPVVATMRRRRRDGQFVAPRDSGDHYHDDGSPVAAASSTPARSRFQASSMGIEQKVKHHLLVDVVLRVCEEYDAIPRIVAYQAHRFCIIAPDPDGGGLTKSLCVQLNVMRVREISILDTADGEVPFEISRLSSGSTVVVYCQLDDMQEAAWYFVRETTLKKQVAANDQPNLPVVSSAVAESPEQAEQQQQKQDTRESSVELPQHQRDSGGPPILGAPKQRQLHRTVAVAATPVMEPIPETGSEYTAEEEVEEDGAEPQQQQQEQDTNSVDGATETPSTTHTAASALECDDGEVVLILKAPGYEQRLKLPPALALSPQSSVSWASPSPRTPVVDREVQTVKIEPMLDHGEASPPDGAQDDLLFAFLNRRNRSPGECNPSGYQQYASSLDLFKLAAMDPSEVEEMYEYNGVWHARSPSPPTIPCPPDRFERRANMSQSPQRVFNPRSGTNYGVRRQIYPVTPSNASPRTFNFSSSLPSRSPSSSSPSHSSRSQAILYTYRLELDDMIDG